MTPEEREQYQKQRKMKTLVAFNFSAGGVLLIGWALNFMLYHPYLCVFLAIFVGGSAAGITWTTGAPKRW
jgi:hypothetical protein